MSTSRIERVQWHQLRVSPRTVWSFVELVDSDGRTGVGEATLGQREGEMRAALDHLQKAVTGALPEELEMSGLQARARSRAEFAVVSALDQAAWDLVAQSGGTSVAQALGPVLRERIAVYANINRGIVTRTPEGFAAQARAAAADGFGAIKIAPFDEVVLYGATKSDPTDWNLDAGLERIVAVREAIGPHVELMVDCHWRLNQAAAEAVLRATEALQLHWLECPVPEKPEFLETISRLRRLANDRGVRLAGCEEMSLVAGFAPFLDAECYDVMMPDVKYVGGIREMLRVADVLRSRGVAFSPHNPSGPVCHAASLQVCAVAPTFQRLEMQYAETPLFDALVQHSLPRAKGGEIALPPGTGLGVRLDARLTRTLAAE